MGRYAEKRGGSGCLVCLGVIPVDLYDVVKDYRHRLLTDIISTFTPPQILRPEWTRLALPRPFPPVNQSTRIFPIFPAARETLKRDYI